MFTLSSVSSILDSRTVVLTIFNIPPATVSHKIMGQQIAQAFYQTHSIALWTFVRIRGDSLNLATTTYLGLKPELHIKVAQLILNEAVSSDN